MLEEFKLAIAAMADAAELSEDKVWQAYLMPETFLYVVGTYTLPVHRHDH